ncbi:mutator type transposase [Tanacetum coccineum]
MYFFQTKGGPVIKENNNSGKQNILGKDKIVDMKGKKVITPKKVDKYSCPWTMLVTYTKECRWEVRTLIEDHTCIQSRAIKACTSRFLADHVIKSLATNLDIPVRAVQDQMQKQFEAQLSGLMYNKNQIQSLLQEFLEGCPWPGQILTAVGVDANNGIYPVAYAIVEAESKASWCWFLNLLGEDLGIEANFNYTFISDRQKGLIQAIASVFPSAEHKYCVRHIHENMKSQFKGGVYKEMLWNAAKATSKGEFKKKMGRAKCDLLINNICEVFNRQLFDGKDQPIITCLEYIREYLMKRIVVVQKVIATTVGPLTPFVTKIFDVIKKRLLSTMKWELTGIPCKHIMAAIYNMSKNSMGVGIPEQWVHAAYRLETWAHVYSFKVNPCNGRDMWLVVESRTVIIPPLYKPPIGRPPKKRKKSNDEIASQSASSGKLSRKGKSVSCGKCGNVGHNRKGCRGQGGGSSQAGARKVSGQAAGATNVSGQAVGARKVSGQAAGATNVSGQAAGARKVSGQAADAKKASSQPSAAQSTAKQGPRQGFQGPIAGPASGSQRKTKKLVDL